MAKKQEYLIGWTVIESVEAESLADAEAYARNGAFDDLKSGTNQVYLTSIENLETSEGVDWDLEGKAHHRKGEG